MSVYYLLPDIATFSLYLSTVCDTVECPCVLVPDGDFKLEWSWSLRSSVLVCQVFVGSSHLPHNHYESANSDTLVCFCAHAVSCVGEHEFQYGTCHINMHKGHFCDLLGSVFVAVVKLLYSHYCCSSPRSLWCIQCKRVSGSGELHSNFDMLSMWWPGHSAVDLQQFIWGGFQVSSWAEQDSGDCCNQRGKRESLRVLRVWMWQQWTYLHRTSGPSRWALESYVQHVQGMYVWTFPRKVHSQ